MPKIAEIEYTPNPNAVKFQLKEPVTVGFPKAFRDAEMAEHDELARGLFAIGHVVSVFMQDKFITVTKDDGIGWTELLPKLAPPIRQAPSAAGSTQEAPHWDRPEVDENDPLIQQIRKVLAASILPALAADGGGLDIVGRHEKQVMIRYLGACGSCPSGLTGTLMAIEGILRKEVDPEIVVITV
ncbi:NifU family protein [Geothrix sp. 21YS21S-2]|uniref:NifU family protein n=1 Tax=Geothrix sp. 21YS21S-2 TaxID=3068893 RepID=UPI0027BB0D58|nr:NifU N-terminal domain-containing protein [Geothrix sp. 21YS21S-2]